MNTHCDIDSNPIPESVGHKLKKEEVDMAYNPRLIKQEIEWVAKAPERKCSKCLYMERYGAFDEKFKCECFLFTTKGNAVCKHFTFKED